MREIWVKKFGGLLLTCLKWTVIVLLLVEIGCFFLITLTNLMLFGSIWKGSAVRYDPYAEFLNLKGVQPTAHNARDWEKAKHIWIMGGSTTRCEKVPYDQSIASFLAQRLNDGGRQQTAVVSNYGENTFNTVLEIKYLQKLLMYSARPPDLIIFYDGVNDCIFFNEYHKIKAHYGYRRLQGPIESYRHSHFGLLRPITAALYASFTLEAIDRARQAIIPIEPNDPGLLELGGSIKQRYAHAQKMAAAYGAKFLVFWQPVLWMETCEVDPGVRRHEETLAIMNSRFFKFKKNFTVIYQTLAADLKDEPYFINFRNILCSRQEPVYDPDGVHLNGIGNRIVAEAMAPVVRRVISSQPSAVNFKH
jgi:lysophospholipase L1-like esterase